ncbi:MAG: hypothetical protein PVJ23_01430 [Anaerolineae bacterium]|jgi:hypothetical protein
MTKTERKLGTWAAILSAVFAVLWFITFNMKDFFRAVPDWQNLTAYADAFRISRFTLIYPSLQEDLDLDRPGSWHSLCRDG